MLKEIALYHGYNNMAGVSLGELRDKGVFDGKLSSFTCKQSTIDDSRCAWDSGMQKADLLAAPGLNSQFLATRSQTGCIMVDCQWQHGRFRMLDFYKMKRFNIRHPLNLAKAALEFISDSPSMEEERY